jgi:hypothetical protein
MSITLSRTQRRQMQKLADEVDRITQSDRRFFERFPNRQHRVRLASQAEVKQFAFMEGIYETPPPAGFERYVLVKNIAPGCRVRLPFTGPAGNDTDVSEREAAWLYNSHMPERASKIEFQLRHTAEARQ